MVSKKQIQEIINKHEPQSLLKMGAPLDEYEMEAALIHHRLRNEEIRYSRPFAVNLEEITYVVCDIFSWAFGIEELYDKNIYESIAKDILSLYCE